MKRLIIALGAFVVVAVGLEVTNNGNQFVTMIALFIIQLAAVSFFMWLYFLGFAIAVYRNHKDCTAIFALNLLTGWTLIGWVASVVWALKVTDSVA